MFSKIKNLIVKCLAALLAATLLFPVNTAFADKYLLPACHDARIKYFCKQISELSSGKICFCIKKEIEEYIGRAPDVFEIEQKLLDEADPRALLITLSTLNYLFDKYEPFTRKLIEYKRKQPIDNNKFTLYISKTFDTVASRRTEDIPDTILAATLVNLGGFIFNNLRNYDKVIADTASMYESGYYAPCKPYNIFPATVIHEFGHLLMYLISTEKKSIDWSDVASESIVWDTVYECSIKDKENFILDEIFAKSRLYAINLKYRNSEEWARIMSIATSRNYAEWEAVVAEYSDPSKNSDFSEAIKMFVEYKENMVMDDENTDLLERFLRIIYPNDISISPASFIEFYKCMFDSLSSEDQKLALDSIKEYFSIFDSKPSLPPSLKTKGPIQGEYIQAVQECISGDVTSDISEYAKKNPSEYVAEAFASLETQSRKKVHLAAKNLESLFIEVGLLPKENARFQQAFSNLKIKFLAVQL